METEETCEVFEMQCEMFNKECLDDLKFIAQHLGDLESRAERLNVEFMEAKLKRLGIWR